MERVKTELSNQIERLSRKWGRVHGDPSVVSHRYRHENRVSARGDWNRRTADWCKPVFSLSIRQGARVCGRDTRATTKARETKPWAKEETWSESISARLRSRFAKSRTRRRASACCASATRRSRPR